MCARVYAHLYACVCTRAYACVYLLVCMLTCVLVCVLVCMLMCIVYACVHACICLFVCLHANQTEPKVCASKIRLLDVNIEHESVVPQGHLTHFWLLRALRGDVYTTRALSLRAKERSMVMLNLDEENTKLLPRTLTSVYFKRVSSCTKAQEQRVTDSHTHTHALHSLTHSHIHTRLTRTRTHTDIHTHALHTHTHTYTHTLYTYTHLSAMPNAYSATTVFPAEVWAATSTEWPECV